MSWASVEFAAISGNGADLRAAHDDGVALHMTEALRVADHAGIEELAGLVLRDGAGNDAPAGIFRRRARSPCRSWPPDGRG